MAEEKQQGKRDQSDKKKKLFLKICKYLTIIVAVAIPIAWTILGIIDGKVQEYDKMKRMSIARLDERGLTEDSMILQEEILRETRYGVFTDAVPAVNITALCDELRQDIIEHFWLDPYISVEIGKSYSMEQVSVFITVNTTIEAEEVSRYIFEQYAGISGYNKNFDRLVVTVNQNCLWEQTVLRLRSELPPVTIKSEGRSVGARGKSLESVLNNIDFKSLRMNSFELFTQADQITITYNSRETPEPEQLLDDYFQLYGAIYSYIDKYPETVIVVDLQCGDSSISVWFDLFRVYQYSYVVSSLSEISRQSFILQYHMTYGTFTGQVGTTISSLFQNLIQ